VTPTDWKKVRLGDVFENRKQRGEGGLPTLSVTINSGVMDRDQLDRKTDSALTPEEHLLVEPGDIAYNTMRMWQGASGLIGTRAMVSPAYVVLKPTGEIDSRFASYLFKTQRMIHLFWAYSHGLTDDRRRLYFDDFASIPVTIPPLAEQQRIAAALSIWDEAIAVTNRAIVNANSLKRSLMQSLLGVAGREATNERSHSSKKLRDVCVIRRGASPRPISSPRWFAETGRGWVRIADVTRTPGQLLRTTEQYLSAAGVAASVPVEPGELIMSICATIGVPKFADIPVCIHDGFVVFKQVSSDVHLPFLYYVLENATAKLANGGQPGTQKNINTSIVGNIDFPDLPLSRQIEIARALADADALHGGATALHDMHQQERTALIQQLFKGKRRVSTKMEAA
jgi:type I restriction enzyme S subunit